METEFSAEQIVKLKYDVIREKDTIIIKKKNGDFVARYKRRGNNFILVDGRPPNDR